MFRDEGKTDLDELTARFVYFYLPLCMNMLLLSPSSVNNIAIQHRNGMQNRINSICCAVASVPYDIVLFIVGAMYLAMTQFRENN